VLRNSAIALKRVFHRPAVMNVRRQSRALRADMLQKIGLEPFKAPNTSFSHDGDPPFLWKGAFIDAVRTLAINDSRRGAAIAHVCKLADEAVKCPSYSVIDKKWMPPSGDKHDYHTGGAYWWPKDGAPEGTPWVFCDGRMNPVRFGDEYDLTRLDQFAEAVKMLALGYRFTGKLHYAQRAAELIRRWFLNPDSRMNPNLSYAQIVPGAKKLTGTGIIETLRLTAVIDAMGLMADSGGLSASETDGVREWFAQFMHWMRTSPNGILERATNNNHGLSYDIQLMSYALFTGDIPIARKVAEDLPKTRIYAQMRSDGSLPEELRRKEAFFYVAYGLGFFFDAATIAERVGVDLWRYRSRDGTGIEPAFRSLMRHADNREPWTKGGSRVPDPEMYALALRGAWAYSDASLSTLVESYSAKLPLQPIDWTVPIY
jgi:hypothetical protein